MAVQSAIQSRTLRAHGLPANVDESDLRSVFHDKDGMRDVRLARDSSGDCCGYALIDFDTQEAAASALTTYNGRLIASVHTRLRLAIAVQGGGGTPLESYQLCVGNIAAGATDSELYEQLKSSAPEVEGVKVPLDPKTRCSRGYGFVRVSCDADLTELMHRLQGISLKGHPLVVRVADHGEPNAKAVFVTNAQQEAVTEDWLRIAFAAFGEIERVRLSSLRNCGTIEFLEHVPAAAAISLLQGAAHGKQGRMLDLRWCKQKKRGPTFADAVNSIASGSTESCATRALAANEEKLYNHEWHSSMQPTATPRMDMCPRGADMNAVDMMYWLSRSLKSSSMPFDTPANKRPRQDNAWPE